MYPSSNGGVEEGAALGKYQPIAKIGTGGQGDVFLAVARGPLGVNKVVVVKRLKPALTGNPELLDMFLDEARLATRLSHPNIVQTFEAGEHLGVYFMVMEYLDGQPLNQVSKADRNRGVITRALWAHIISLALRGLHYAHELADYDGTQLNIVHRDISPHNIFVTYAGEVKLVDFGIAKASLNTTQTDTGVLKGKVGYMAPEQAMGHPDRRADLFSMGVVLWEAIAGRRMLEGDAVRVLHKLINEPIPKLSSVIPDVEPALEAIVDRALKKNADERYQTAEEFSADLDAFVRSCGEVPREGQIAKLMKELFDKLRAETKRRIQDAITNTATLTPSSTSLEVLALNSSNPSLPSLGGTPSSLRLKVTPTPSTTGTPSTVPEPPQSQKKTGLIVAGAGLLAAAVIGAIAATRAPKPQPTQAAQASSSPAPAVALVEITSSPEGALVDWNGRPMARTPAKIDLPPGKHTLLLSKEGYKPTPIEIDVAAGEAKRQTVQLLPKESTPAASVASASSSASASSTTDSASTGSPRSGRKSSGAPAAPAAPVQAAPAPTQAAAATTTAEPKPTAQPPATAKIKVLDDDPRAKVNVIKD